MVNKATDKFNHKTRDIIYIASNDDVAAIVEAIKTSNRPLVCLVSPKRADVLTSTVNLKLIATVAREANKNIALITTNTTTTKLAGRLQIPVAINLQTAPEVPTVANNLVNKKSNSDKPIEIQLPDSFIKRQRDFKKSKKNNAPVILKKKSKSSRRQQTKKIKKAHKNRPKHILPAVAIAGVLLSVIVGIWYLGTAESQISVKIQTSFKSLTGSLIVNLSETAQEPTANPAIIPVQTKKIERTLKADIVATGKETRGDKAEFIVNVTNCQTRQISIPLRTTFSRGGFDFISLEKATIPGAISGSSNCIYDGGNAKSIKVQAQQFGAKYNVGTGEFKAKSLTGLEAIASRQTKQGRLETVSVITQNDIDKARQILESKTSSEDQQIKQQLRTVLTNADQTPLAETLEIETADPEVNVEVGQEAKTGQASQTVTYQQKGVKLADIDQLIKPILNQQAPDLEILDSGLSSATFTINQNPIEPEQLQLTVQVFAAKAAPALDHDKVWELIKLKKIDKAAAELRSLGGIESANVSLSPKWAIWVTTVPTERDNVKIEINGTEE